jgi:hypothetical protein
VITESDIGHLPEPVKRSIRAGGYIGKPKVDEGEFIRFESHDRPYEVSPGIYEVKPYSIRLGDYHESGGIKVAGQVFAIWHLEDGDFTYWDGKIAGLKRGLSDNGQMNK